MIWDFINQLCITSILHVSFFYLQVYLLTNLFVENVFTNGLYLCCVLDFGDQVKTSVSQRLEQVFIQDIE